MIGLNLIGELIDVDNVIDQTVETLSLHRGFTVSTKEEDGGTFTIVYRHDGSIAADTHYGDEIEMIEDRQVYRYVGIKVTRRGDWWTRLT